MQYWRVQQGHVLNVWAEEPECSVQSVVTSPPYWGLRDYGLPPTVWDVPDDAQECEHEWGSEERGGWANKVPGPGANYGPNKDTRMMQKGAGAFCGKCGAWQGCLGHEPTIDLYISHIVQVCRAVRRVLRKDGVMWLNIGDCYVAGGTGHQSMHQARGSASKMFGKSGRYRLDNLRRDVAAARSFGSGGHSLKPKDLCMIPARVAIALQDDGWWIRQEIVWHKPNAICESAKDRPHRDHEMIYMLTRSRHYYYDQEAVRNALAAKTYTTFGTTRSSNGEGNGDRKIKSQNWRGVERKPTIDEHGDIVGSNLRSVWAIGTTRFKGAHFATFPPKLAERCILASTSAHGACPECGAPYKRIVHREAAPEEVYTNRSAPTDGLVHAGSTLNGKMVGHGQKLQEWREAHPSQTMGWEPTCKHTAQEPVPCVVGDPFSGAGTTGYMAVDLGRSYFGSELSEQYIPMSQDRLIEKLGLIGYAAIEEGKGVRDAEVR